MGSEASQHGMLLKGSVRHGLESLRSALAAARMNGSIAFLCRIDGFDGFRCDWVVSGV